MKIIPRALALAALVVAVGACGSPGGKSPAPTTSTTASAAPAAAATVTCTLTSCASGKVGQPCSVASYPGIVVQAGPTELACDPSPPSSFPAAAPSSSLVTDPNGVTCPFLDSTGYCPGDAPATTPPVLLSVTVTPGCSYGGGTDANGNNIPNAFIANQACTDAELNQGNGVASSPVAGQEDAYQVTVTNSNSYAVPVSEVIVGYYDTQGNEISNVTQNLGIIQIAPGATVNQVYDYTSAPTGTVTVRADHWQ
jgi:hypothetical protein